MAVQVPIFLEPVYDGRSVWCAQLRHGMEEELSRKKYAPLYLTSPEEAAPVLRSGGSERPLAIVAGLSPDWTPGIVRRLALQGVDTLLAGYQPMDGLSVRGSVRVDHASGIECLMSYLRSCGKTRLVLYGCCPNSSSDMLKRSVFERLGGEAVIENRRGMADCFEQFLARKDAFDAALCVNDLLAASLITRLQCAGVSVPGDVYVACFGDSETAKRLCPSVTAATLNYEVVGIQAVALYAYLSRAAWDVTSQVLVKCRLHARESTACLPPGDVCPPLPEADVPTENFYQDEEVAYYISLERLLTLMDALDERLLALLMSGHSYDRMADQLNMPLATVRYRIRRMSESAGGHTRSDLVTFLRQGLRPWTPGGALPLHLA
jgi:DNA-binding LacI/PurR family transcriptional regulator/DNA-binding CsgD family transcriptional regulator